MAWKYNWEPYVSTPKVQKKICLVMGFFGWSIIKNVIRLWALPKYCKLLMWALCIGYKRRILGKRYGKKCSGIKNMLGTYWEHTK
jgi:hypothetical protein